MNNYSIECILDKDSMSLFLLYQPDEFRILRF